MAIHPPTIEHVQERDGELYIGASRVTLSSAISAWKQGGQRPESILAAYPSLSLAAAYGAVAYYLDHQDELEAYFAEGRQQFEQLRAESRAADPAFHANLRQRMEQLRQSGFLQPITQPTDVTEVTDPGNDVDKTSRTDNANGADVDCGETEANEGGQ